MPPRGLPLGSFFSIFNSRSAVFSQSTELAGRCRLLGAGEPHPKAKSKSYYSSSRSWRMGADPAQASIRTSINLALSGATPRPKSSLFALLSYGLIIAQNCPVVKCYFEKMVFVGRFELPTHSLKGYYSSS